MLLEGRGIPFKVTWLYLSSNPLIFSLLLLKVTPTIFFNPSSTLDIPFLDSVLELIDVSIPINFFLSNTDMVSLLKSLV